MASLAEKPTMSPTPTLNGEHGQQLKKDGSSPAPSLKQAKGAPAGPPGGMVMQAPIEVGKLRFLAIFASIMLSIFLFALDQLIVATAIPSITNHFHSLDELPWLASGFFLTLFAFNLMYSQWLQIFPSKHVLAFAVGIFELGSLVCGVAPSMNVLILGRAIAGLGGAGIFSGGMIVIAELTPLHSRPKYFGLLGVCFALASVLGPLVGGAFSDHVSWRWCFYINLPIGGLAFAMILAFQPHSHPLGRKATYKGYSKAMLMQLLKCDWLGVAIAMAWAVCLILPLQWGGVTKPWSDGSVIACLVMIPVLAIVFFAYEWWLGEHAMFKLALIRRRTIAGASAVLAMGFGTFMVTVYYLAEAYQAVYHTSATGSGIRLLPLILVQIAILIASSRIIPKLGRFKWVIVAGPCFCAIGSGLLYSVDINTNIRNLYGYQAIFGVGIGLFLQNSMIAVQFELKSEPWLISAGTGIAVFLGFAGRILGISLGGAIFENQIQTNIRKYASDLPAQYVNAVVQDANAVWDTVPDQYRHNVLIAYTKTLSQVYIIGLPMAILAIIGGLCIKNSKMQTKAEEEAAIKASRERDAAGAVAANKVDDAIELNQEAGLAAGVGETNAIPAGVAAPVDAQAALAEQEGKSAV
ncbi:MFS transporter, DHA2 family, glioxin efflux transporter, partial [Tremellales sp. Uapishka_1]